MGPLGECITFLAAHYGDRPVDIDYDDAFDRTALALEELVDDEGWTPWARTLDAMHQGIDGLFASARADRFSSLVYFRAIAVLHRDGGPGVSGGSTPLADGQRVARAATPRPTVAGPGSPPPD